MRSASQRLLQSSFSLDGLSAGGGQTSCCIDDEEEGQRGRQRSDSHRVPGSVPGCFPPRHDVSFFLPRFRMHYSVFLPSLQRVLKSCRKLEPEGRRDASLKGTAPGGPIWALHQQAQAATATST